MQAEQYLHVDIAGSTSYTTMPRRRSSDNILFFLFNSTKSLAIMPDGYFPRLWPRLALAVLAWHKYLWMFNEQTGEFKKNEQW
jgi:hypothetical protein